MDALNAALSGRYTIERELGAGGMATVYLAQDVRHHRKVALKVLRPELSAILGAQRFLAEIKTTANLQHPHILSLFDSGEADGTVFYVMPYVEGETLRDRIKRDQQLPVDEAVRIAREVLDALEYAHQHGVVHRDIKPENILLHGGHAMVADFGIALAASKVEGGTRMTETGMSLGTPHYMSPEQAMGERIITGKADIYALGCVLYEMLTAEPPFTGASAQAIFARVLTDEPRSLTLQRRTIPPHVEAAVKTALQKLPADRFATAAQFAAALADSRYATASVATAAAPSRPADRGWTRVAMIAGATAVATLAAGFVIGRGTAPRPRATPVHFTIALPDSVTQVNRCCGRAEALSPDGATLVYVGTRGSGTLYRRSAGRLESQPIPGAEEGRIPFFSPDGQWLGFVTDDKMRKVSMNGGPSTPITSVANQVWGATWGDNGLILFSQEGKLWTVPATGGSPTAVPKLDSTVRYMYPFFLPGSKRALVEMRASGAGPEAGQLAVLEIASGKLDTIGFGMRAEYANGYLVFGGSDGTLLAQPFDPSAGKATGPATVMLSGVQISGNSNPEFTLSNEGWMAYMPGGSSNTETLRAWQPSGSTPIDLPGRTGGDIEDPAISPDGRRIVLQIARGGSVAGRDLWILDRRQETLTRFTVGGGQAPVWSRDGKRIAYYVPPGDAKIPSGIYVRAADLTGTPRRLLPGFGHFPASWTPGDQGMVFVRNSVDGRTSWDIGAITVGDTLPRWLVSSEFNDIWPQLSPDGRRLAFGSDRTGRFEIYVQPMTADAAPVQVSTDGGSSPRWSPDGRTLYFVRSPSLLAAVLAPGAEISVTSRRVVMETGIVDINQANVNWDVFPDGKQFLHIDREGSGAPRIALIQHWVEMVRAMGAAR